VKQILTSFSDIKKALSVYGIAYFVLLMFVFGLQYVYPKPELHLLLNSNHTGTEDTFPVGCICMGSIIGFVSPCLIFYFGKAKILKLNKE